MQSRWKGLDSARRSGPAMALLGGGGLYIKSEFIKRYMHLTRVDTAGAYTAGALRGGASIATSHAPLLFRQSPPVSAPALSGVTLRRSKISDCERFAKNAITPKHPAIIIETAPARAGSKSTSLCSSRFEYAGGEAIVSVHARAVRWCVNNALVYLRTL